MLDTVIKVIAIARLHHIAGFITSLAVIASWIPEWKFDRRDTAGDGHGGL